MRIHIQNPSPDDLFVITPQQWAECAARWPDVGLGHDISYADDDAGFAKGIADAEILIGPPGVLKGRSLAGAKALKIVFVMAK